MTCPLPVLLQFHNFQSKLLSDSISRGQIFKTFPEHTPRATSKSMLSVSHSLSKANTLPNPPSYSYLAAMVMHTTYERPNLKSKPATHLDLFQSCLSCIQNICYVNTAPLVSTTTSAYSMLTFNFMLLNYILCSNC